VPGRPKIELEYVKSQHDQVENDCGDCQRFFSPLFNPRAANTKPITNITMLVQGIKNWALSSNP
jgi:hypothetical protein